MFTISWVWFWIFGIALILFLGFLGWRVRRWHHSIHTKQEQKELPEHVQKQLEELQNYRKKYGVKIPVILILFLTGLSFLLSNAVFASIEPPIVNTISKSISNEEIFYIEGKTIAPQTEIILYLQNIQTGETKSYNFSSDNKGDWFYRHDGFLSAGKYILWAQSKIGDELSPPTPQLQIAVYPIAIQFGASRLGYTVIYLILIIVLFVVLVGLVLYIALHARQGRKKHALFIKEVREAEESVKRGFAVLRRDIQAELALINKAKLTKQLSEEEDKASSQLLKDLGEIECYIGKEVWDVEKADYSE